MHKSLHITVYLFICFFLLQSSVLQAEYIIEGTVNMKGNWQPQIFLATVDKLDDYYKADASLTINQAPIDDLGNFIIRGDNLPDQIQFYRLYLIKESESEFDVCLYVGGDDHNYIHLILDNESEIKINADQNSFAPFGDYQLIGDEENKLMKQLNQLVYPSHHFYEIKFPSELKFSRDKLNRDLFNFSDTCQSTMVSLAAINITDFENYIDVYANHYESIIGKMKTDFPKHPYTNNFERKYRYFNEDWNGSDSTSKILNLVLALLCLALFLRLLKLQRDLKQLKQSNTLPLQSEKPSLTIQEKKILNLIAEGKLNKEIASELFIELSTVKTHINKIYSKLDVKDRKAAIESVKHLQL